MTEEHDLSAFDGLLDDIDIEEKGDEDPRAAKLKALFEKAKASYTAKIDTPTWFISSTSSTKPFNISAYKVPNPAELLAQRKGDRKESLNQEWTVNHLYSQGHFETCLCYVTSFAVSVGFDFPFHDSDGQGGLEEYDASQAVLHRSKQEKELSKNWGMIKDLIDAGVRSLLALLRNGTTSSTIETWVPMQNSSSITYKWDKVSLLTLARGFLPFCMREIRIGAGDTRSGYSGMVVCPGEDDPSLFSEEDKDKELAVNMDKVRQQNWTVTSGLALTAGDLALELGLYRTAIEAHTLFLATRGHMWRVLLALAHELACYHQFLGTLRSRRMAVDEDLECLKIVAKASVVSALQAAPRARRMDVATSVLVDHRVIPSEWIEQVLSPDYLPNNPFEDEDDLLFYGLMNYLDPETDSRRTVLPEEIGVALVKVIFAKKSGLFAMYQKFPTYMREYRQRLASAASNADAGTWEGLLDEAAEEDGENNPRSVRTL